jgi:hypothetical protein
MSSRVQTAVASGSSRLALRRLGRLLVAVELAQQRRLRGLRRRMRRRRRLAEQAVEPRLLLGPFEDVLRGPGMAE